MTPGDHDTVHQAAARAQAEVARAIASSRDLEAVLDLVVERVRALLGAQKAALMDVGADERLRILAARGFVTPLPEMRELRPRHARDGIPMIAMTERRPVWSADCLHQPLCDLSPGIRAWVEREGVRAGLAAPLLADTRVLGALLVYRDEVRDFSPEEVELARAFADHAVIALEAARLSSVEASRLRQEQALVEVERELLGELEPNRLFPLIVERASRLAGADGRIWVVDRGRKSLRQAWTNWPGVPEDRPFGEGVSGVCAEARRGILVTDYATWPSAHPGSRRLGVRTAVAQPLLSGGELLGVITMSRMDPQAAPFEPKDLALLERFAAQAALALRNATLYGQAEQRRRAAEELARLARTLSDRLEPAAVAREIARSVLTVFDVYSCNIRLLRPDGGLEAIASQLYEVGHVQPPGIGLSARALAEGRAVWTADLLNDPGVAWDEDFRRRNVSAGRRAALVVPMRTERGIIGVFQMSAPVVREFSDHEVEIAQGFADQAALALESARLHGDLRASEERTRLIVDTALDAVITIDMDGRITGWNAQAEQTFGWSREEVLGRILAETIVPPRYRAAHAEGLRRYRQSGEGPVINRRLELSALHRDGREFPVELSISPVSTQAETSFSAFVRDITERQQAEAAIHRQTALVTLLQQVAVAANEAPTLHDALQIGVDQVCAYTGWPVGDAFVLAEDGSGELVPALIWHLDQPQRFRHFQDITNGFRFPPGVGLPGRVLATGQAAWIMDVTRDSNFPRAQAAVDIGVKGAFGFPILVGSEVVAVLEFFASEPQEPDPALLHAMANIGTQLGRVFERHRSEAELRLAKDAAETASRAKSSFLANMSHELRTPLNAVLGYAQVLKRNAGLSPKQEKALDVIEQSGEHLLSLINEILDLAKIEAGTIEIHPAPFDLPGLLQGIADIMRARAEDRGLAFTGEWPLNLPAAVRTDEKRLRQVLMNLLDNAVKYTSEGGVALKVGPREGRLRFLVEDTGIGIHPEHLPRIFETFHQVRDPRTFVEGTGLGLAISKTLVSLLGGTLDVSSTPGEGSRFWFDLDLPEVTLVSEEPARPTRKVVGVRGDRRRILVVDDKGDNRRLVRDLLVPLGFEILQARDGETCLRLAASARPHAILLDLRMPGMDGFEATRRLRATAATRDVVIIAVSASAFEPHREQCLDAGADDFLPKPFRLDKLLDLLCRHLGLELIYAEKPDDRPPASEQEPRVLDTRIVAPAAELPGLLDLARRGDITKVLERARQLEEADDRYASFATELRSLAERFQVKRLCQFLEDARPEP